MTFLSLEFSFCTQPKGPEPDPFMAPPAWFLDYPLADMRVVGIDPGLRDFITAAVRGDSRHAPSVFR